MNWKKIAILILAALLFIQIQYFGLDDCQKCSFGDEKISMKEFFLNYNEECLSNKVNITIPDNLTFLEGFNFENE